MSSERGDVGWSVNTNLKSSGDAPATARAPTPALPHKHLSSSSKEQDLDFQRAVMAWSSEQLNRAQPWKHFADTAKFSMPKSAQEMTNRIRSNADHFRTNYGIIFVVILVIYVMSSVQHLVSVAAVVAVGAALKLHQDDDSAAVWGTRLMIGKNQRLAGVSFVALLLLYTACFWSAIVWSVGLVVAIGIPDATLYAGQVSQKATRDSRRR
ncbi:prenylated Rab acceptor protein 1 [Rhipicephalus sanguineus]|uniref:PRA1 family protein n=1 Tax=Rhipicephalus sanguineus TaxID=34632 RepID=A0A9D4Q1B1_RHISA|nr:prenylated Rab acceptor protein 1 [Rhipicephalus sanguineus]KAH7962690.1 hypothetical protein HPB52_017447 [Rhipicephalus sanguineus]